MGDLYCKSLTANGMSATNSCCAYVQLTKNHGTSYNEAANGVWTAANGYPTKEGEVKYTCIKDHKVTLVA